MPSAQTNNADDALEAQILDSVDHFVRDRLEPRAESIDKLDEYPQDLHDQAAELGLFGLAVPAEYGGLDVAVRTRLKVIERLARSSGTFSVIVCTVPDGLDPLRVYGSEELKQTYLPGVANGKLMPAIAMSEPGGGSDVASMKTTARKDGEVYVLNGTKAWCTHGSIADFVTVFAKTDPESGHRGISAFLVPKGTPGFEVIRDEPLTCLRGSPQSTLQFHRHAHTAESAPWRGGRGFQNGHGSNG